MPLLLGCRSSARAESPDQRDTHGLAAAQLLLEELERRETGDPGSLGSFWCPVQREGTGREVGEPKLPLLSCPAAVPESCPQARGHVSPAGELCSPVRLRLEHPPALPQQCAQPQLLQRPGAAEREEKQREAPLPRSPWAEAGACRALPRGEGHGGRRKPRGAGQRRCPSPGSRRPARAAAFALAFWGPKGEQGVQDVQMPPPSLPVSMLPAPCPGSARRAEAVPSTAAWPCLGTSRALPWHVAPALTRRWQHRSRWAR